jgi:hypothetical protein
VLKRNKNVRVFAVVQAAALMFVLGGMGDCSETTAQNPGITAGKFDPASAHYVSFVGDTVAMVTGVWTAVTQTQGLQEITDARITWTSSNTNVAQLITPVTLNTGSFGGYRDQGGVFKVVGIGTSTITGTLDDSRLETASGGPLTYTATIEAIAGQPVSLQWSPAATTINVGERVNVIPEVRTATGALLTSPRLRVTCNSRDIAEFASATGTFCDVPNGTESPRAFALHSGATLEVIGKTPGTATFTVSGEDQSGVNYLNGRTSTLTVTVRAPAVASSISIETVPLTNPPQTSSTITVGATRQLRAVVRNQYNDEMPNAAVTWTSSNTGFATVVDGLVRGVAPGAVTVVARSNDVSTLSAGHTVTVQSTASAVSQIHISPSYQSWSLGPLPTDYIAVVRDAAGNNITAQNPVTWSSSNEAVVTVDQAGRATGMGVGGALVTASAGGKSMSGGVTIGARGAINMEVYLGTVAGGIAAYGATLTAFQGTTPVGTGIVNQTGRGYIPGLPAGTYNVTVSLPGYTSQTVNNITVVINSATPVAPIALLSTF